MLPPSPWSNAEERWPATAEGHQTSGTTDWATDVAEYPLWVAVQSCREWKPMGAGRFWPTIPGCGLVCDRLIRPLFNARDTLKAYLRQLDRAPSSKRNAGGKRRKGFAFTKRTSIVVGAWLSYCSDRALDAYTLKEVLRWQQRIVVALTGIIETVPRNDWPTKTDIILQLMHERARHKRYVQYIEVAMAKNETVEWMR